MSKRSIESGVEDLEDEHTAANEVSLDEALRAMQADEPAGAFLAEDVDPPPVLLPVVDEGFCLVDPFSGDLAGNDVRREAASIFRDVHDLSVAEFRELHEEVDR